MDLFGKTYITEHNTDTGFICKLCLSKFHGGVLLPACILNNLAVKLLLDVLFQRFRKNVNQESEQLPSSANDELYFEQMPHRQMIRKVKDKTFHLPLPLQETLNKICPPEDSI